MRHAWDEWWITKIVGLHVWHMKRTTALETELRTVHRKLATLEEVLSRSNDAMSEAEMALRMAIDGMIRHQQERDRAVDFAVAAGLDNIRDHLNTGEES
jgi:hypothetical protein